MEKQTSELLQQLANQLGTTTEYVWSILLKQSQVQFVNIIIYIIFFTILILSTCILFKKWDKRDVKGINKWGADGDFDFNAHTFAIVCLIISSVIGLFAIIIGIIDLINIKYNPEYWALEQILGKIKDLQTPKP